MSTLEPTEHSSITFDGAAMRYRIGTHDLEMLREIWEDRYYTDGGFDIPHGATVLDMGGGMGGFSVFAGQQYAKKVYTFEPEPSSYDLLVTNTSRNKYASTTVAYKAAITTDGEPTHLSGFSFMEDGVTINTGIPRVGSEGIPIQSFSIHEVLNWESYWDVMKVDIEGYEYELFDSMTHEEWGKIQMVTMEFHGDNENHTKESGQRLVNLLESVEFEVRRNWAWGNQGRIQAKRIQ